MTNMYYKETWPVSKWELIDQKICLDFNDSFLLAVCVKIGELTTYEVNQLGACPKILPRLCWMSLDKYCQYKTYKDDTIIW